MSSILKDVEHVLADGLYTQHAGLTSDTPTGSDEKVDISGVTTKEVETTSSTAKVHRGLRSHHIALMTIGGVIGTGLFGKLNKSIMC